MERVALRESVVGEGVRRRKGWGEQEEGSGKGKEGGKGLQGAIETQRDELYRRTHTIESRDRNENWKTFLQRDFRVLVLVRLEMGRDN